MGWDFELEPDAPLNLGRFGSELGHDKLRPLFTFHFLQLQMIYYRPNWWYNPICFPCKHIHGRQIEYIYFALTDGIYYFSRLPVGPQPASGIVLYPSVNSTFFSISENENGGTNVNVEKAPKLCHVTKQTLALKTQIIPLSA